VVHPLLLELTSTLIELRHVLAAADAGVGTWGGVWGGGAAQGVLMGQGMVRSACTLVSWETRPCCKVSMVNRPITLHAAAGLAAMGWCIGTASRLQYVCQHQQATWQSNDDDLLALHATFSLHASLSLQHAQCSRSTAHLAVQR
jgi:hypothetical protein